MPLPRISEESYPVKPNVRDMSLSELEAFISAFGKEKYRAKQIMKWLYQENASSFDEMTDLSKSFRAQVRNAARIALPEIIRTQVAKDSTKKILFGLEDGLFIESVLIPGKNHWTACISTQAGCRMGCAFCFTGSRGFRRNLLPSEITGQITRLLRDTEEGKNLKNVVMMGMGEPLANYENVVKAIRVITAEIGFGFSHRKITLSTCGIAPMIEQLGKDICINLAISLNAADDKTRSRLMPVNKKYPMETLLSACRNYPMPGRRMLTFEYILIAGVNSAPADAEKLARLLRGIRCKLNLIAFNEFPGSVFKAPSLDDIRGFQQVLLREHYTAIIRASKGSDIMAACGQLSGQATERG
ncbi:MAG TPA: 23S rRNA (adenine(2503)-C(2))-methyltransferase RlmN [Syntrophales bacterium]|nr:23S rRNA (adenine(2503)-C(2))-methyltransferase RlmN [Syntrophales bacterium]